MVNFCKKLTMQDKRVMLKENKKRKGLCLCLIVQC